ncbi:hypothetical protein [Frankia sp. Cj3]|uniref:hypothetical protein n=1 Tax=Frankia sp. Cj3 TaxID=2880976 RepID=UPI001EF6D683|nr:hypothetical protein [Frankia sp. Cj3]
MPRNKKILDLIQNVIQNCRGLHSPIDYPQAWSTPAKVRRVAWATAFPAGIGYSLKQPNAMRGKGRCGITEEESEKLLSGI